MFPTRLEYKASVPNLLIWHLQNMFDSTITSGTSWLFGLEVFLAMNAAISVAGDPLIC
jgi:hypothetical protein